MSNVERLGIEPIPDRTEQPPHYGVPPAPPAPVPDYEAQRRAALIAQQSAAHAQSERRAALHARILAALNAIALIVSARLLLLLATCFAFVLALQAMRSQTNESIALLVVWAVLVVLPHCALDWSARKPPPSPPSYSGAR